MFYYIVIFIVLLAMKCYLKLTSAVCDSDNNLDGKVVIITGANAGIGLETAKDLASRKARVILACRSESKAKQAQAYITNYTGNQEVIYKHLDLTSLKSVREFCADIIQTEPAVHILINNAGTGKLDNSLTEDKLPIEMQVNHFAPLLLTKLLLPLLKSSAPSRIIFVSSFMHWFGDINLDSIGKPAGSYFGHSRVYSNSKLANILVTKHLHKMLIGTGVTVNCLHPGAVNTEIFRNQPGFVRFLIGLVFKTPWEGAQTSIYLATCPKLEGISGKYFADCKEKSVSSKAKDEILAEKLWEVSLKLVAKGQKLD